MNEAATSMNTYLIPGKLLKTVSQPGWFLNSYSGSEVGNMRYITRMEPSLRRRILGRFLIAVVAIHFCVSGGVVLGQGVAEMPTRFGIKDRAPDLTVFENLPRGGEPFHRVVTGDFNGDGISDLLITNGAGTVYVILGKKSFGSPAINLATEQPDLTVLGSSLGFSAAAGDVSGDGIDDIIVSAVNVSALGRVTGAIYVIFGSRGFNARLVDLASTPVDVTVFGGKATETLGPGLAVGDINADGANDLIFRQWPGSPENVSILLGPFARGTTFDLAATPPDVVISGGHGFDAFGAAIAVADVNGDGTTDLIIGSPSAGRVGSGFAAGAVDILMGSRAFMKGAAISLSQGRSDATILGAFGAPDFGLGDRVGEVISIGDVNADGINDVVLGVPASTRLGNGFGPTSAGEAYVVFGSPLLPGRSIDIGCN